MSGCRLGMSLSRREKAGRGVIVGSMSMKTINE